MIDKLKNQNAEFISMDANQKIGVQTAHIEPPKYFTNPVTTINAADPTIYDGRDGYYYMYYTGALHNNIYHSKDLVKWEDSGKCPFNETTLKQLGELFDYYGVLPENRCLYAPTVISNDGTYLMYVSIMHYAMVVLKSSTPYGPFRFDNDEPYVLLDKNITRLDITFEDSCVAQEVDGTWYLMWGSHGRLYRTTLTKDGLFLSDTAEFDHVAGSKLMPNSVYEGLYAYRHKDYWYLFAARGNYNSTKNPYQIVVGRSKTLNGVFRNKLGARMDCGFATCIMDKPKDMSMYLGGGHTGEIILDKEGNYYIFYPRQLAAQEHYRHLFLQRIYWDKNGWPYFEDDSSIMKEIYPKM